MTRPVVTAVLKRERDRRILTDGPWIAEPVGGANGDEPVSPVAIATSVAAHPRRSPFSLDHSTMLPDFQPPVATDEHDRKLLSDVESVGWHVLKILGDDSGPEYCFSVGFYYTFGHPEILVMGLSHPVAHRLINLAAGHIASGRVFRPRERTDDLAEGFTCSFVPVAVDYYEQYLGYGIWFYRKLQQPFPALQLVWPDKQGRLPWESGYDEAFYELQRLLDVV